MTTKMSRIQQRRTDAAGKVPTASDLLTGELGLNVADRKMYSKDANANVFQIGGAPGRNVGDYLAYEDFGGFPLLATDSRLYVKKENPTAGDYANFVVLRDTAGFSGGTPGNVNAAALVNVAVNSVVNSFEWGLLAQMSLNAAGGGEHCAFYSQGVKNANGTLWASCFEMRDNVSNPTTGSLGMEMGMFVNGGDASGMRHGIDISIGSTDSLSGTNVVTSGIRIGPTSGDATRAQLINGIDLKGRAVTGLNLSNLEVDYSDVSVAMPTNGKIRWKDGDGFGGATRAELAWNAAIDTWQFSGVATSTSANAGAASPLPSNPNRYITMQVNGDLLKVPAYNV
jgi:hypothetical protein